MNIDPVCGMEVDEREAPVSYLYQGRAFFFCSEACMRSFSADPAEHLRRMAEQETAAKEAEKGGFLSRWIKRLGEHAEKSPPPKCH